MKHQNNFHIFHPIYMERIGLSSTMEGLDMESSSVAGQAKAGVALLIVRHDGSLLDQGWWRCLGTGNGVQ
jgi:hypothetical protein